MNDVILGVAFVVLFTAALTVNGLVSAGVVVPVTNAQVAATHPVYLLPSGFTFSIWAVIYALLLVYAVLQVIPKLAGEPTFAESRPWALAGVVLNPLWLFLFNNQWFWIAFIVIVAYLAVLAGAVRALDFDWLEPRKSLGSYALRAVAHSAFAINTAWVAVATVLQLQVNLLEEGYYPSSDLSTAIIFLVGAAACVQVFRAADVAYAAATAWALVGVISNQSEDSPWGCVEGICAACDAAPQRICTNGRAAPLGWQWACDPENASADACPVPKSMAVVATSYAMIGAVALALILGVVRGLVKPKDPPQLRGGGNTSPYVRAPES